MSLWGGLKRLFGSTAVLSTAEDLFAGEVAALISGLPGVTSVKPGEQFSVAYVRDGQANTAFLRNVFAETRDMTAAARKARIERFIAALTERDEGIGWDAARERLVPLLRAATLFQSVTSGQAVDAIRRPFAPFLMTCIGLDAENSFSYVSRPQVTGWGVDLDTVFATASENGARYFDGTDVAPYGGGGASALWHVAKDDSYESSRLVVPGWLASFAGKVSGRPVAIVPSRSRLIVGGDGDERCLAQLIESARREYEASPRNISPALYTVDEQGAVVPLVLPPGHPLAADVAIGHALLAATEYTAQQEVLQPLLGDDVYVTTVMVTRKGDVVSTVTTWTKEAPSLLARADRAALVSVDEPEPRTHILVPWQALLDLAGDCLRFEPGYDPPRWRTERWPDPVTLEKLKAAAIRSGGG